MTFSHHVQKLRRSFSLPPQCRRFSTTTLTQPPITALLFPGQGSQYSGMARSLYPSSESCPYLKELLEEMDEVLQFKLSDLMKNASSANDQTLMQTENAQPAILTSSIAILSHLQRNHDLDYSKVYLLGHSLGEYTALVAAKVISFPSAINLVHQRGKFMNQAKESSPLPTKAFSMQALMPISKEDALQAVDATNIEEVLVSVANHNSHKQVVLSGYTPAVKDCVKFAKEHFKARKAIPLKVNTPFHSALMKPASTALNALLQPEIFGNTNELNNIIFNWSASPIDEIVNVEDLFVEASMPLSTEQNDKLAALLTAQVHSCVRWSESIDYILDEDKDRLVVEIGPREVLVGLAKQNGAKGARHWTELFENKN